MTGFVAVFSVIMFPVTIGWLYGRHLEDPFLHDYNPDWE